jgi:hypothetical protein
MKLEIKAKRKGIRKWEKLEEGRASNKNGSVCFRRRRETEWEEEIITE